MVSVLSSKDSGSGLISSSSLMRCTLEKSSIGPETSPSSIFSKASSNSGGNKVPSVMPKLPSIFFVPSSSENSNTKLLKASPSANLSFKSSISSFAFARSRESVIFNMM